MRIYQTENYQQMSKKAANIIAAQIISNPESILGLATGSTPIGTYKNLVKKYQDGDIDFKGITSINLDEYVGLSKDDDQSYRYFMNDNLFNHVNIDINNTYVPDGTQKDAELECKKYDEIIKKSGGIDLQLLGIGQNSHIGFNEPDSVFTFGTHCVDLTENTINANARFFDDINKVPKKAYSMGIGNIFSAKKILLVASGENKAQAVYDSFFSAITPNVPASILQLHSDVILVADKDALKIVNDKGLI